MGITEQDRFHGRTSSHMVRKEEICTMHGSLHVPFLLLKVIADPDSVP